MTSEKRAREVVERILASVERYGTLTGKRGQRSLSFPAVVNIADGSDGRQIMALMTDHVLAAFASEQMATLTQLNRIDALLRNVEAALDLGKHGDASWSIRDARGIVLGLLSHVRVSLA